MFAPAGSFLRRVLALKVEQLRWALGSYLRDRTHEAVGTASSYGIAIGLFVVAAIFMVGAGLVGLAALFRWIEIHYGMFEAFGAVALVLVVLAAICAGVGLYFTKRRQARSPALASRLRVALTRPLPRIGSDIEDTGTAAAAMISGRAPKTPLGRDSFRSTPIRSMGDIWASNRARATLGLMTAATLLGWVAIRRWPRAQRR